MAEDHEEDHNGLPYNAAGDIAQNIVAYFRVATISMAKRDLFNWYKSLEAAYIEVKYKFKEKERIEMDILFKQINPYTPNSYCLLKLYHSKLRDLCYKYQFFTMGAAGDPKTAVYR